jgi:hypothetical protein
MRSFLVLHSFRSGCEYWFDTFKHLGYAYTHRLTLFRKFPEGVLERIRNWRNFERLNTGINHVVTPLIPGSRFA